MVPYIKELKVNLVITTHTLTDLEAMEAIAGNFKDFHRTGVNQQYFLEQFILTGLLSQILHLTLL